MEAASLSTARAPPPKPRASFSEPHPLNRFPGNASELIGADTRRRMPFRPCFRRSPPHQNRSVQLTTSLNLSNYVFSCSAAARSNINEDTDDMFDDLFKKYGKVVFRSNDQKAQSAEVDDDAQSLSFAVTLAKVANDVKGAEIKVLFVKPLVYWTRFFIIVTAFSNPQIDAIKTKMQHLAEDKFGKVSSGDSKPNSWTLLDFGDVVVHIFLPQQRSFYNLEEFYGNATLIELPFEDQQPFRY